MTSWTLVEMLLWQGFAQSTTASVLGWAFALALATVPTAALASFLINKEERYSSWKSKTFGAPFPVVAPCLYALLAALAYSHMPVRTEAIFVKAGIGAAWIFGSLFALVIGVLIAVDLAQHRKEQIAESHKALTRFGVRFWTMAALLILSAVFMKIGGRHWAYLCGAAVVVVSLPVLVNGLAICYRMLAAVPVRFWNQPLKHPQFSLYQQFVPALLEDKPISAERFVAGYSWSILPPDALKLMCTLGPIADIGAGTGYVAWLLWQLGVDVVAYDISPGINLHNKFHQLRFSWFPVRKLDGERAAKASKKRALLFCWPPPEDNLMSLRALKSYAGDTVIFIGPACRFGDTWDDSGHVQFQELLRQDWQVVSSLDFPSWSVGSKWKSGCDHLRIFKRKNQNN